MIVKRINIGSPVKSSVLLVGWIVLGISIQALSSSKTYYYPTGAAEQIEEYVDDKVTKCTLYLKTGEIDQVEEYIDGKWHKDTIW